MASRFRQTLQKIENHIQLAQISKARQLLLTIPYGELAEAEAIQYAHLSRRSGSSLRGLKMLKPFVNIEGFGKLKASDEIQLTYAAGLNSLHLLKEANAIFLNLKNTLDPENKSTSQLYFFMGLNAISRWDYENASQYFSLANRWLTNEYVKQVAMVNYLASLVYLEKYSFVLQVIDAEILASERNNWNLLVANLLEIKGQAYLFLEDYEVAKICFEKSIRLHGETNLMQQLLLQKWQLIMELRQKEIYNKQKWYQLRTQARHANLWELCRDLDFYSLFHCFDSSIFHKLIYGTPFDSYKIRLIKAQHSVQILEDPFIWNLPDLIEDAKSESNFYSKKPSTLKIISMKEIETRTDIFSVLDIQGVKCLSEDFYRPVSMGQVYTQVFSDQYFQPETGYQRVQKFMQRLRIKLKKLDPLFEIGQYRGHFYLAGKLAIEVPYPIKQTWQKDRHIYKDLQLPTSEYFSSREVAKLNSFISYRQVMRKLNHVLEKGIIGKIGQGPSSKYFIRVD